MFHGPLKHKMTGSWIESLDEYNNGSKKYQMKFFIQSRSKVLVSTSIKTAQKRKNILKWDLEIFHGTLLTWNS